MRADTADAAELNDRGQDKSFTYDAFLAPPQPFEEVTVASRSDFPPVPGRG